MILIVGLNEWQEILNNEVMPGGLKIVPIVANTNRDFQHYFWAFI